MKSIRIHLYQGKQELKLHTQWLHGRDFVQFGNQIEAEGKSSIVFNAEMIRSLLG